jgi:2-oxoisovalerate dehydrogenase E1 component beta subunit
MVHCIILNPLKLNLCIHPALKYSFFPISSFSYDII